MTKQYCVTLWDKDDAENPIIKIVECEDDHVAVELAMKSCGLENWEIELLTTDKEPDGLDEEDFVYTWELRGYNVFEITPDKILK